MTKMIAEILFLDPNDMVPCSWELGKLGFTVEHLDWEDPCGPTKWINARGDSELDQSAFFDWMKTIVEPLGGDVVEAGYESNTTTIPTTA